MKRLAGFLLLFGISCGEGTPIDPAIKTADRATIMNAENRMRKIGMALMRWQMDKKSLPDELDELVEPGPGGRPALEGGAQYLYDPWGNSFAYEHEDNRWTLYSDGPDGEPGTDDDLTHSSPQ